ncbi:putative G10 protein [Neospora caninum Liverpool]|uniref:Putative G10 protein n=1 Tax=Neospora caninum (strain Liverpool) TaxID=572307 RepID=F0VQB8_NEOCL|nr:putative G10 protein [Neospora caninum Liverpool]CBZ55915.1 putative G10 protein [Neospora caninum Liverpool]|eukprot:XP_003885941.1 putative G10 protein [Neospora caninum Liverpool]
MPKIRTLGRNKKPPEGWELIEVTLLELNRKMREAELEPHEGKRKCESTWPIFKLHHQRSRYIYDCYYKRKAISSRSCVDTGVFAKLDGASLLGSRKRAASVGESGLADDWTGSDEVRSLGFFAIQHFGGRRGAVAFHPESQELYEYCLREGYADAKLIAKWKKPGYEKLCCLRCIQASDQNFSTTCICRVPKNCLADTQQNIQCVHCGCRGCASGD